MGAGFDPWYWMKLAYSKEPALSILMMVGINLGAGLFQQLQKSLGKGESELVSRGARFANLGLFAKIMWSTLRTMFGG